MNEDFEMPGLKLVKVCYMVHFLQRFAKLHAQWTCLSSGLLATSLEDFGRDSSCQLVGLGPRPYSPEMS